MPRMRHPNGAGPYDATDGQVNHMRMAGWLTAQEWPGELGEFEPAPPPDEDDKTEDAPGEAGEDRAPARPRARAAGSKKEKD